MSPAPTASAPAPATAAAPARDYYKVKRFTPGVVAADVFSGFSIALLCSIPVCLIDTSVMRKVSGIVPSVLQDLSVGFRVLFTNPSRFFSLKSGLYYGQAYRIVVTVYGLTFAASNVTKSFCEANGFDLDMPLLGVSAFVNTMLTIWKDSTLLNIPAIVGPKPRVGVPFFSKCCFATRDTLTCFAAFVFVDKMARYLRSKDPTLSVMASKDISQIICPSLLQYVSTPIHITGITYSNLHPNCQMRDIYNAVTGNYVSATHSRMLRIIPSFGIGAMGSRKMRSVTTEWAEKNGY